MFPDPHQEDADFLAELERIATAAGDTILEIYNQPDFMVTDKADRSPLTAADLAAHHLITDELTALFPEIPVISEEGSATPWQERQHWHSAFLVDPLDGTKEFLKRNGEFTVNLALIRSGVPAVGVVHAPVLKKTWSANATGAWRTDISGRTPIAAATNPPAEFRIVASRSHADATLTAFLDRCPPHQRVPMGSSLKLCLVADGSADLYPRLAPTMEWDTAAAHAVCLAAGAAVTDRDGTPLRYNKPDLRNPHFVVAAPAAFPWQPLLPATDH